MRGTTAWLVVLALVAHALGACAAQRSGAAARRAPARTTATRPVPVDPARARAMRETFDSSVVVTTPSREALQVLGTIPEPLRAGERVPAPAVAVPTDSAAAVADTLEDLPAPAGVDTADVRPAPPGGAAPDTSGGLLPEEAAGAVPADTSDVPVPEPQEPLGDTSAALADVPDSLLIPSRPAGTPPAAAPAATPVAAADTCWGVQVAAPPERERAETMRSAAQSVLMVEMKIETAGGRHRVRTAACLDREAADNLRRRAVESGFAGAFRVGGPQPAAAPVKKPAARSAPKRR